MKTIIKSNKIFSFARGSILTSIFVASFGLALVQAEKKEDPATKLPTEIFLRVLQGLTPEEYGKARLVATCWNNAAIDFQLQCYMIAKKIDQLTDRVNGTEDILNKNNAEAIQSKLVRLIERAVDHLDKEQVNGSFSKALCSYYEALRNKCCQGDKVEIEKLLDLDTFSTTDPTVANEPMNVSTDEPTNSDSQRESTDVDTDSVISSNAAKKSEKLTFNQWLEVSTKVEEHFKKIEPKTTEDDWVGPRWKLFGYDY